MADYAENICQAVDEIIKTRLAQMSYDTTIKCNIIDVKFANIGKYLVTSGLATFYAYTHLTNLKKGDTVYVLIPNRDYDEQKFIIGKAVNSTEIMANTEYTIEECLAWVAKKMKEEKEAQG